MEELFNFFITNKEFIYVIILSIFLGVEVISNVPAILHTPLMSGANCHSWSCHHWSNHRDGTCFA